jgi:hypothetical protein
MTLRWRLIFPFVGLSLFAVETYHSIEVNRQMHQPTGRYFWWSSIRLDSDPLNQRPPVLTSPGCQAQSENCSSWDTRYMWIDPGFLARVLMLSAAPAFIVGVLAIGGLGRLGLSEVLSFLSLVPALMFAWYYFLGWLVDRLRNRHQTKSPYGVGAT